MLAVPKTPGNTREKEIHNTMNIFIAKTTFVEIRKASF